MGGGGVGKKDRPNGKLQKKPGGRNLTISDLLEMATFDGWRFGGRGFPEGVGPKRKKRKGVGAHQENRCYWGDCGSTG